MIEVEHFHNSLKKEAAVIDGILSKGFSFVKNHPWITLGSIVAGSTALSAANKVHPLHQIYREETKNKIFKEQNKILLDILHSNKKITPPKKNEDKLLIQPLS